MSSISILDRYTELKEALELAIKLGRELDLELVFSPILDDTVSSNIVKEMEYNYLELFKAYKYSEDLFVRKVMERAGVKQDRSLTRFPYYVIPFSDSSRIKMTSKISIPARCIIEEGTVRLSFLSYRGYSELEEMIHAKEEDDVKVTFKEGRITNFDRKRTIFIEPNLVTKILSAKGPMEGTLWSSVRSILIYPLISMNVYEDNSIILKRTEDDISVEIEKGKASRSDVLEGKTVSLEEKAKLYYDFKTKKNLQKEVFIKALLSKLP